MVAGLAGDRGAARAGARRPAAGLDDGLATALRSSPRAHQIEVEATEERFNQSRGRRLLRRQRGLANAVKHARARRSSSARAAATATWSCRFRRRPRRRGARDRLGPDRPRRPRRGARWAPRPGQRRALERRSWRSFRAGRNRRGPSAPPEGLARLFADAGHEVVAAVGDADKLRAAVCEHGPTSPSSTCACRRVHRRGHPRRALDPRRSPDVGVLVLSQHVESAGAVELVSQSGFGYLLKDRVLEVSEFMDAAERVERGGSALDPQVVASSSASEPGRTGDLTSREAEVLSLMAEGLTNSGHRHPPRAHRANG